MNYLDLKQKLLHYRGFNPEKYIDLKLNAINQFFLTEGLDSAVIGLSGGVDSAVVLTLLHKASKIYGSPIKNITALIMPINCEGTTGQELATNKAINFCSLNSYHYQVNDLSEATKKYLEVFTLKKPNPWSIGQLASIVRTPALYFQAALLQQDGLKSIVIGTTNRDEGSYIGFFGKASDAMVDLQPIADLHKTELYQVAKLLDIPEYITKDKPRGDVWDNRCDEEMIGAPYDFLQIYLLAKERNMDFIFNLIDDNTPYIYWSNNIEKIHTTNLHKYKVGNSSRFINVIPSDIPGGWQNDKIKNNIL